MTARKSAFLVPYTKNGSLMHYEQSSYSHHVDRDGNVISHQQLVEMTWPERQERGVRPVLDEPDMRPNDPWSGTLRLVDYQRGRSAARFIWEADGDPEGNKRTYPMFMTDMLDLVKHGVQPGGLVHARWDVAKRGANYGIRLAAE